MKVIEALTAELRLIYEYDESDTFANDAQRIIDMLNATTGQRIDTMTRPVTLTDALDQAGVPYTRIKLENEQRQ